MSEFDDHDLEEKKKKMMFGVDNHNHMGLGMGMGMGRAIGWGPSPGPGPEEEEEEMFGIPIPIPMVEEEWELSSAHHQQQQQQQQHGEMADTTSTSTIISTLAPPLAHHPNGIYLEEEEEEKVDHMQMQMQMQMGAPLLPPHMHTPNDDKILARLNQCTNSNSNSNTTSLDLAILKMSAYKLFSEASPVLHFLNLTSNQPILDCLHHSTSSSIHILDFDFGFGFGAHWASFMQDLALLHPNSPSLSLTITAFSFASTSPVELSLIRDNLCLFAAHLSLPFSLHLLHHHSTLRPNAADLLAVNLPANALPGLLSMVKQLSPHIVVSQDRHYEHSHSRSHATLLESLYASNLTPDSLATIDNFLLLPATPPSHHSNANALLASAGFSPIPLSNFTQAQAQCLLLLLNATNANPSSTSVTGFHLQDRDSTLSLCWRSHELVSVSAWTPSPY